MAVVVVGDITKDSAMAMITRHFGGLVNPADPRPREYADVPPYQSSRSIVVTDKEAISYNFGLVFPAYKIKPTETPEEYRQDLVQNLYENMLNARFRELTQKENPPFLYAGANFGSFARLHESFNVQAATGTNDIRKGIDAVAEEIERVKRHGFTEPELERAKKDLLASYENAWNNRDKTESAAYADEYIRNFTTDEPVPGIGKEFEMAKEYVPGITLTEVNSLTEKFSKETNRFAYVMGPDNKDSMTAPSEAEVLAALDSKTNAPDIKPYAEAVVATTLLTKEPTPGTVAGRAVNPTLGTTTFKLSNGVTVTFKPTDFKDDEVLMAAYRFGGTNKYDVNDKYNAENAVNVASNMGFGNLTPTDMRKVIAGKTASVNPYITGTTEGFRGSSSNKDVETMLQMLYLQVTEPRVDSTLFRSYIQRNKAQFAMMGANPQIAFIDTVVHSIFGNNPLGPTPVPRAEHFDKVDLSRSAEIYKEHFGDVSGMQFYFVGSMKIEEMIPLIEKYIGSLPASGKTTNYVDNQVRPVRGDNLIVFRKGKEEKSLILSFFNGPTPFSPDLGLRLQALSAIMNIKIFEEMREKIQGIYTGGTSASISRIPYSNFDFFLRLPCGPQKVDTLIEAFETEMTNLAMKGPDTATLQRVKTQWLEEYKVNMKTNDYWLSKLQQFAQGESSPERMLNFERIVNAMQPSDIRSAARMVMAAPSKMTAVLKPE
jgi:zinc protease